MALKDHLNKIEYFCAIVQNKSILKASEAIGISQPQLSKIVKQLEEDLQKPLLIRSSKGIEPTKNGKDLFEAGKIILEQINNTERQIKYESISLSGMVKIGTYDSIGRYFFPSFLKYLSSSSPDLKVNLTTARSAIVYQQLVSGELDIAICVDSNIFNEDGIKKIEIYTDSFGFYHHPSIDTEFLDKLILFPESIDLNIKQLKSYTQKKKFQTVVTSDNLETVKSLAEQAVGVALLPHRVAREAVLLGKLTPLLRIPTKEEFHPHTIVLCVKENKKKKQILALTTELKHFLTSWSKN